MNETPPHHETDALIVGAGPAGLAMAVALAQAGLRSRVLEQAPLTDLASPAEDGRDIALTHRARRILETLNIWQRLPANEIAPLRQAHVRNGTSPLVLPFDARTGGHQVLGWLVPNHRIRAAAHAAALDEPLVRLQGEARVVGLDIRDSHATLRLADGCHLSAPLIIAADSRFSSLRRMAGIGARMLDFGRTAIVCRIAHERDHEGIAHECFFHGHTLAMLPMAGRQSSAVLTLRSDQVAAWQALDGDSFAQRLQAAFGDRLGRLHSPGQRHAYPLVATYAHRFAALRVALVGDAAVGMHPVTAHGYNFGLYGVATLARELARSHGRDDALTSALEAYAREHRRITLPIYLGTNAIVQLFTDDRAAARLLRDVVLCAASRLPPLQSVIMRQLTGGAQVVRT